MSPRLLKGVDGCGLASFDVQAFGSGDVEGGVGVGSGVAGRGSTVVQAGWYDLGLFGSASARTTGRGIPNKNIQINMNQRNSNMCKVCQDKQVRECICHRKLQHLNIFIQFNFCLQQILVAPPPPTPIQRWLLKEQTDEKSILMDFNGLIIYPLEILATSLEFQNISLMKK